ncbi:Replicase polyprotein 1TF [Dirofilaria immitis]
MQNDSNANVDYKEINITEIPICAGKGFSCPSLYSNMQLLTYCTTVADFAVIPFMIYLSFVKVKDSLFKYFTLNIMMICSVIAIADFVADGIDIAHLFFFNAYLMFKLFGDKENYHYLQIPNSLLALYAAVICYIAYVYPIFYAKHFVNKSQKLHYVVLHTSLFLWNGSVYLIRREFSLIMPYYLTHLILFITLFIVAVTASIEIYKYKPPGMNATLIKKMRRKRLLSFVIYSYATEFIVLPRFIASFISLIFASRSQIQIGMVFDGFMRTMIHVFYEMNSIAICLSTIFALEPYRHAVLLMFRKQKSSTTKVRPINAINLANINMLQR